MKREEDRGEDDGGPTDQGGKNEVAEDNGGEASENEGSFQAKKDLADVEWVFFSKCQHRSKKGDGRGRYSTAARRLQLWHVQFDKCVFSGIRVQFGVLWTGRYSYSQNT
jgi:hypothetical protein